MKEQNDQKRDRLTFWNLQPNHLHLIRDLDSLLSKAIKWKK
jgi:REP element-mobilizing transposase RayT